MNTESVKPQVEGILPSPAGDHHETHPPSVVLKLLLFAIVGTVGFWFVTNAVDFLLDVDGRVYFEDLANPEQAGGRHLWKLRARGVLGETRLPPSARSISLCRGGSLDLDVYLVFTADREDLSRFVRAKLYKPIDELDDLPASRRKSIQNGKVWIAEKFGPWREIVSIERGKCGNRNGVTIIVDLDRNRAYVSGGCGRE